MSIPTFRRIRPEGEPTSEDLGRLQDNIGTALDAVQGALTPKWVEVPSPYANGWVASQVGTSTFVGSSRGNYAGLSYLVDASGFVHLRGLITGGTIAYGGTGTVWQFPKGLRPLYVESFASADGSTVAIYDNGDLRVGASSSGSAWLTGICWLAEQ